MTYNSEQEIVTIGFDRGDKKITSATDHDVTIQAVLDKIKQDGAGGVLFLAGTYSIGTSVKVPSNIKIRTQGRVVFEQQTDAVYRLIENDDSDGLSGGNENIDISGITFKGKKGTFTNGDDLFFMNFITDCNFEDLEFEDSLLNGIRGKGDRCYFNRIKINNSKRQGFNWQGNTWSLSNSYVDGVDDEFGIVLGGHCMDVKIYGNSVFNTTFGGIEWGYSGENIQIFSNYVENCDEGIEIQIQDTILSTFARNCSIYNNTVVNCVSTGVLVRKKSGFIGTVTMGEFRVYGNNVYGTPVGVRTGESMDVSIESNFIDSGTHGVVIDGNAPGVKVIKNHFKDLTTQGVSTSSDGTVVIQNFFDGVTFDMVNMNGGAADERVVNNIYRNVGRDIVRNQSGTAIVSGNVDIT